MRYIIDQDLNKSTNLKNVVWEDLSIAVDEYRQRSQSQQEVNMTIVILCNTFLM